jgi:hypothetical protein
MLEKRALTVLHVLVSLSFLGCSAAPETLSESIGTEEEAILDGAPTNSPTYGAVAALVVDFPEFEYYDVICSATLVAPTAAITARHCTPWIDLALQEGGTPYLAFGPSAWTPEQLVPITSYVAAPASPTHPGLLLDGGRDVAVAYLESAPTGITPAKLGRFKKNMLGDEFEIAGFGISDFSGAYGDKFLGEGTIRALSGQWYSLLFDGDKQAYLDWYFTDAVTVPTPEEAEVWWNIFNLEPEYEVLAMGLPGQSTSCFGDSGGPLLQGKKASNLTTYGVSFATESTFSTICGLGNSYAVFNKDMLRWVEAQLPTD